MSVVKQLYELQEIEIEAESLERVIAGIGSELKENEALLKAQSWLKVAQETLEEAKGKQRAAEWELEDLTEKIAAAEKKLYSGRTGNPKELVNLQSDLDNLKGKRSQLETKALETMEQAELAQMTAVNAKSELTKIETEKESRELKLREELNRLEPLLSLTKKRREELLSGIVQDAAECYYRIKSQKRQAVAKIEQGVCRGCRISLPAREIQQARGNRLVQCSSCGRLLYMP